MKARNLHSVRISDARLYIECIIPVCSMIAYYIVVWKVTKMMNKISMDYHLDDSNQQVFAMQASWGPDWWYILGIIHLVRHADCSHSTTTQSIIETSAVELMCALPVLHQYHRTYWNCTSTDVRIWADLLLEYKVIPLFWPFLGRPRLVKRRGAILESGSSW